MNDEFKMREIEDNKTPDLSKLDLDKISLDDMLKHEPQIIDEVDVTYNPSRRERFVDWLLYGSISIYKLIAYIMITSSLSLAVGYLLAP